MMFFKVEAGRHGYEVKFVDKKSDIVLLERTFQSKDEFLSFFERVIPEKEDIFCGCLDVESLLSPGITLRA